MSTKISIEEAKRQEEIMNEIRQINNTTNKVKRYFILTLGCQMNAHDSEKLIGMLEKMGYQKTEEEKNADLVIYNTCCVRENAEQKVYGRLGMLKTYKRKNPNMKIAICGCMMQQPTVIETIKKKYKHVDVIFGTHNLYKFAELLKTNMETKHTIIDIWKEHGEIVEDLPSIRKYPYKACVNIMFGCNNFCTYCIVPYVRGRERSRQPEDIIKEIQNLVDDGVQEIMLLGQNVNSYGKTLEDPITFAQLIRKINEIEGLKRIRFMTSHPKDLSDELIEAMKDCKKVCKHLHLPIQSGSTDVLKRMNRRYTKESYLELVRKIKLAIPDISLTTDIIVGFPGETEEDFNETLDVIKKVRYDSAFTFLYSIRTGTPAAKMEDQVEEGVAKERFNRLIDVLDNIMAENNVKRIGQVYDVLVEEVNQHNNELVTGRTSTNHIVHFKGTEELIGKIIPVKITKVKTFYLMGECI